MMQTHTEYLEGELEQYREAERRREVEWLKERDRREVERKAKDEVWARTADSWPEALRKQIRLYEVEANFEVGDPKLGTYFIDAIEACWHALELWARAEVSIQLEIDDLQRQIDELWAGLPEQVAKELDIEADGNASWAEVARALREDDCNDWLQW